VSFVALVRRPEQREELLKLGAAEVFLSSDADWRDRARAELQRRGCVIGIDSIGGPATGEMLSCLAKRGKVIVIGFLSGQPSSGIESADLLGGKVVTGFQLGDYASERTLLWQKSMIDRVAAMIKGELQTEFTRTFPFTEVGAAMAHYQAHQSEGKVLLALD
jgi:NADPH:quinone reductase-like Zn-dependent oxidoreductase